MPPEPLIVCHACDLVHRRGSFGARARVRCTRCRADLYCTTSARIDTAIAVAASALLLLGFSNVFPLVELQVNGVRRETTLWGAAAGLFGQGYTSIAALVLLTTEVIPLIQIGTALYVLVPLKFGRRAPYEKDLFRLLTHLRPWALPEVFMLGALVALVKLAAMAQVVPGIALFAYGALMLSLSGLWMITPMEQYWQWVAGRHE